MAVTTDSLRTVFEVLGLEQYKRAFEQAAEANKKLAREEKKRAAEGADNPVTGAPAKIAGLVGSFNKLAGALFVVRQAVGPVVDAFGAIGEAFITQEQAFFRMNLVLRNLGRSGEISGLIAFNQGLATTTGNTSAALAELTALLVQFGLTDAEIRKSTPVLLDWSRAVGIDATRAADILGSALRNEKDAIQRYGVDIDLTKTRAEKLDSALKQLEARFRGGAQASAGTLGGSMERLKAQFEETEAALGRIFSPVAKSTMQALGAQLMIIADQFKLILFVLEKIGLVKPLGSAANGVGGGANAAAINPEIAQESTQKEIAAHTKKTAEQMGSIGKFIVGGGAAASAALNIRGLNAALRAGR